MPCSEPTPGSPELVAMMLADTRFPSGGYAQSAGLEPAVRAGLTADGARPGEVFAFAAARLRTVTAVDAGTAVVSRHTALHTALPPGAGRSGGDLAAVEDAWAARTPSRPLREASRLTGRGYLRLAARLWPEVRSHLSPDLAVARPVVIGVVGAVTGLSGRQVARLVGYDDVQTVAAAALKLLPLDPAEVASWTLALHGDVEAMSAAVAALTCPDDIPDRGAPALDTQAEQHRRAEMRLFHV
jgi:urease accessory protein